MAYCRLSSGSDVYAFPHVMGGIQFYLRGYAADEEKSFRVATRKEALHRLERLRTQGYSVPDHALMRLRQEIEEGLE